MSLQRLAETIAAIHFFFEDVVGEEYVLDLLCVKKILCQYYNAEDCKELFTLDYLKSLHMPYDDACIHIKDNVYYFDVYEIREMFCPSAFTLTEKMFSKDNKKTELIRKILLEEGKGC